MAGIGWPVPVNEVYWGLLKFNSLDREDSAYPFKGGGGSGGRAKIGVDVVGGSSVARFSASCGSWR